MPAKTPNRVPELVMCLGIPASGKTTWAKEQVHRAVPTGSVIRVNKDDLRTMLMNGERSLDAEKQIEQARDALIETALRKGVDVIVDDTNIHPRHETRLRQLAVDLGVRFRVKTFPDADPDECITRDAARPKHQRVGKDVIVKMARDLRRRQAPRDPIYPDPYVAPEGAPTCVIVDIDGTLALMSSGRGPYDYHRVDEDTPNEPVADLVRTLILAGEHVIAMSGRDECCRDLTKAWLDEHIAEDIPLHMRPEGDGRPDYEVKLELFQQHIAGKYQVRFVVDDRLTVTRMWRRHLGLTVLQVDEGQF